MGRPIGCTTASELAIRSYLTKALHHHGAWCPPCSRSQLCKGRLWTETVMERQAQAERQRVGWKMDRGAPQLRVCLGNRIDQQRGSSPSLGQALVLTFRSPCVARGDAPVNHPTPTSSSPCGYTFRGLMKTIWSSCRAYSAPLSLSLGPDIPAFPSPRCLVLLVSITLYLPVISKRATIPLRYGDRAAESRRTIRGSMRIGGDARIARGRREAKRPRKSVTSTGISYGALEPQDPAKAHS